MSWKRGVPQWPRWPILQWGREYRRETLIDDGVAAAIVTVMLIPQSLAYALLAGLPAQVGLYASVAPLLLYAALGSSRVLAVGPVAVVSLMTAAVIGELAPGRPDAAPALAMGLALLSGAMLLIMGALRLGLVAQFLSHPVIAGFISASGILIATSQLKLLLGVSGGGQTLWEMLSSLWPQLDRIHLLTALVGFSCIAFLFWVRSGLEPLLRRWGLSQRAAAFGAKLGPVLAIVASTTLAAAFDWRSQGLKTVGTVPAGLPPLTFPVLDISTWKALLIPALLISIVGFVESVSVGQTLAAKRRQRIEPDQELFALGAGNVGAALTGGLPVTGGFSRSVVNFDAGARTPAAGIFTAVGILLATLLFTPALFHLPHATLAATIVVAVLSLVDVGLMRRTWRYSKGDFAAMATTLLVTLAAGVEAGLILGVLVSLVLHLWRTSQPHIAEVGWVPGTEHFRNVLRHSVRTAPDVLALRVDESLYFANARALEDRINAEVALRPELRQVVLQCSAINDVDASALESLEAIDHRLRDAGMALHLSEVKGPVMDKLQRSELLRHLSGRVFLTHFQAIAALSPQLISADPAPSVD